MNIFITIVIIGLIAMVVISLVRGLIAFLAQSKADIDNPGVDNAGATQSQMMQNKMMFARIKYQALAVIAVAVLLLINR